MKLYSKIFFWMFLGKSLYLISCSSAIEKTNPSNDESSIYYSGYNSSNLQTEPLDLSIRSRSADKLNISSGSINCDQKNDVLCTNKERVPKINLTCNDDINVHLNQNSKQTKGNIQKIETSLCHRIDKKTNKYNIDQGEIKLINSNSKDIDHCNIKSHDSFESIVDGNISTINLDSTSKIRKKRKDIELSFLNFKAFKKCRVNENNIIKRKNKQKIIKIQKKENVSYIESIYLVDNIQKYIPVLKIYDNIKGIIFKNDEINILLSKSSLIRTQWYRTPELCVKNMFKKINMWITDLDYIYLGHKKCSYIMKKLSILAIDNIDKDLKNEYEVMKNIDVIISGIIDIKNSSHRKTNSTVKLIFLFDRFFVPIREINSYYGIKKVFFQDFERIIDTIKFFYIFGSPKNNIRDDYCKIFHDYYDKNNISKYYKSGLLSIGQLNIIISNLCQNIPPEDITDRILRISDHYKEKLQTKANNFAQNQQFLMNKHNLNMLYFMKRIKYHLSRFAYLLTNKKNIKILDEEIEENLIALNHIYNMYFINDILNFLNTTIAVVIKKHIPTTINYFRPIIMNTIRVLEIDRDIQKIKDQLYEILDYYNKLISFFEFGIDYFFTIQKQFKELFDDDNNFRNK